MTRRPAGALSLLLLFACSACALLPRPLPVRAVHGEQERIQQWLSQLRSEGQARRALRAHGSLKLDSPNGSGSVRQVILAERPDRVRLESLNLLGQTQSLLVVDAGRFSWFDGRALERGAASIDTLRERVGLDLAPREVIEALLIDPQLCWDGPLPILGQGDERIVEAKTHRLRFAGNGDLIGLEALDTNGAVRWSAVYDRWRDAEGGRYPFGVKLFFPSTSLRAELELREVELNAELDPKLFRLPARGE